MATPTIDPVPMVAASAVASAPKLEISPSPFDVPPPHDMRSAWGSLRWMKPVRTVRKIWVPSRSAIIAGPHTTESMVFKISIIVSWYCKGNAYAHAGASPERQREYIARHAVITHATLSGTLRFSSSTASTGAKARTPPLRPRYQNAKFLLITTRSRQRGQTPLRCDTSRAIPEHPNSYHALPGNMLPSR